MVPSVPVLWLEVPDRGVPLLLLKLRSASVACCAAFVLLVYFGSGDDEEGATGKRVEPVDLVDLDDAGLLCDPD